MSGGEPSSMNGFLLLATALVFLIIAPLIIAFDATGNDPGSIEQYM